MAFEKVTRRQANTREAEGRLAGAHPQDRGRVPDGDRARGPGNGNEGKDREHGI